MKDQHKGWTTLAALVMVRVLAGDREAAAQVDGRREEDAGIGPRRIVVSLADRKLAVVDDGRVLRVFNVAVGAPASPSPVGRFTIVNRLEHPGYYTPGKVIAPGASNPLGTRWMGLDVKGYGIHGTDQPGSIGHARSHGCIRLRNRDVEELFALVREGDVVELLAGRTPEMSILFDAAATQPAPRDAATARIN